MRFSDKQFNRFLANIGQQVTWRRAYRCPCTDDFSGAAQVNCPSCSGKGIIWTATATPGTVGVVAQKVAAKWAISGNWEDGDVGITIGADSPLYVIGRNDRVVLLNAVERFNRIFTHGTAPELLSVPLISIDRVFWLNSNKTAQIEGGIPTVTNGVMSWASGEPPAGTQYSVTGTAYVEYFVWSDLPSNRNEHSGMQLPKKLQLRKLDLFGR